MDGATFAATKRVAMDMAMFLVATKKVAMDGGILSPLILPSPFPWL